jgi:hypothetical protein
MSAVENDQAVLMMPRILYVGGLLRTLLPTSVFDFVQDLLGVSSSMDSFKGRAAQPPADQPDAKRRKNN